MAVTQGPSAQGPKSAGERFDSWKEIAAYLKRDVRTVQRWEKCENLPVHRHFHNKQGTVYAFKTELDLWWANEQSQLAPGENQEEKKSG